MRSIVVALSAVLLLAACEEEKRPVLSYKPGVYQGAQDAKLDAKARKDADGRAKHMGRM